MMAFSAMVTVGKQFESADTSWRAEMACLGGGLEKRGKAEFKALKFSNYVMEFLS